MVEFLEVLEDDIGLLGWHSCSRVSHDKLYVVAFLVVYGTEGDFSACGVFAGVGQEVVENLSDAFLVGVEFHAVLCRDIDEFYS